MAGKGQPGPAKGKGGAPSKLTPERQAKVVEALKAGLYRKDAAAWAGVSYDSMRNWMNRGQAARSGRFRDFFLAVVETEEKTKMLLTLSVLTAARGTPSQTITRPDGTRVTTHGKKADWKAAAWMLSRKYPEEWAEKKHLQVDAKQTIDATFSMADEAELDALLADPGTRRALDQIAATVQAATPTITVEQGAAPTPKNGTNGRNGGA